MSDQPLAKKDGSGATTENHLICKRGVLNMTYIVLNILNYIIF